MFVERINRKVNMDANHELTQEECPICGYNKRNIDFTEECPNCYAKKFIFGWYLLKNEIWTIRIIIIMIVLAIILFAAFQFWLHHQVDVLEKIISSKSIQIFFTYSEKGWLW